MFVLFSMASLENGERDKSQTFFDSYIQIRDRKRL